MALAVHLRDTSTLDERVPFESGPPGIENCWGPGGHIAARGVVKEARNFVSDTAFSAFCQTHGPLYRETESRYRRHIESEAHLEWFPSVFGHRTDLTHHIILCLHNAHCCYAAAVSLASHVEYYCFLGVPYWDGAGVPIPSRGGRGPIETIVHEFVHSYTNETHYLSVEVMRDAGERLLERAKDRLDMAAYGDWKRVIDETLARAFEVRYLLATRGRHAADDRTRRAVNEGFLWTAELAELLADYEADRVRYPAFAAFVPRLTEFFREQAGLSERA